MINKKYNKKGDFIMFKKKLIGITLISLILFQNVIGILNVSAINEPFKLAKSNSFGSSESDDLYYVTNTQDSGFITVGNSNSTDIEGITNKGGYDGVVVKYNINDNQEWIKSIGGTKWDFLCSGTNTFDAGFIAIGYFSSTDIEGITNKGGYDALIIKYDINGNQEWIKSFGGNNDDYFNSITNTQDGGFIIVGSSDSTDIEGITNKGFEDAFIIKYDINGNQEWIKSFGGSGYEGLFSITETSDGGFVTVGYSNSIDIAGITNKGFEDAFIIKYDINGNQEWIKSFGGSDHDYFNSVINTSNGDIITVGSSYSTDIEGITNKGFEDAFIIKYDINGNQEWIKSVGGTKWDEFTSVTNTSDGGFVAVGSSYSTDIEGITNNGDVDALIVKYDKQGRQQWIKSFGGNDYDVLYSVTNTSNGGFITVGESYSTDMEGITNNGDVDGIIFKYIDPLYVKPLTTNSSIDLQIVADNSLELSISTNKISFEGYNGVEDLTNNNLNLTVSSGLYYDLYATLDTEIRGTNDTNAVIDKANLKIKTSDDLDYKSFTNIGEKVNLVANHKNGKDFVHNINLKLLKDSSVKADTYNTNITFEVVQK